MIALMMYEKCWNLSLLGLTAMGLFTNVFTPQAFAEEIYHKSVNYSEYYSEKYPENRQNLSIQIFLEQANDDLFLNNGNPIIKPGKISQQAVDLQIQANNGLNIELTRKPVELEQFCQTLPNNSHCVQSSPAETSNYLTRESTAKIHPQKSGWSITPEVGTLGLGASVTKSLTSNLNARVGLNAAVIGLGGYQKRKEEVSYDATLNLFNVSTLVDYHPFKNSGFRVTSGLVFNNNNIEGKANIKDGVTFEYDGNRYTNKDIAAIKGKVSFPNNIAPYLGIGWGNAVKPGKRWGFSANLGVVFAGSPQVDLDANIVNNNLSDQINRDLRVEEKELEDDLKGFTLYPVLSLGVSYHF
jgi:hypothetical protein